MNHFPVEDSQLNDAIAAAFRKLATLDPIEEDYHNTIAQIEKLHKLKNDGDKVALEAYQTDIKREFDQAAADAQYDFANQPFYRRVDPNTAATVAGNLLVALVVVHYEQRGVIATKLSNFIMKRF